MVATTNYPGSSHFNYHVGTKKECQEWLEKFESKYGCRNYYPHRITSNKEAAKWRYRDGQKVIDFGTRLEGEWSDIADDIAKEETQG